MRSVILPLALVLLAAPALAETKAADGAPVPAASSWTPLKKWFENLKKGLAGSAVESHYQKRRGVVAVAAVRGRPQGMDDPGRPYLKGTASSKEERALRKQRREFEAAVDLALAGKTKEAEAAIEAFLAANPTSALAEEAKQAREKLAALPKDAAVEPEAEVKPAETPAAKADEKPAEKAEAKVEEKPAEKPEAKAEEKPAEKSEAKPEEKPAEKPEAKAEERPAEKPAAKSEAPAEEPVKPQKTP